MWDREFHFSDDKVIQVLQDRYISVAVDEWYHSRRKDDEGEFYRKVVFQREGMREGRTTQGLYIFSPDGKLLKGWNNRDVPKLRRYLTESVKEYTPPRVKEMKDADDPRYARDLPEGAVVVDLFAKITEASWPAPKNDWEKTFRRTLGRDHLWITKKEVEALARGKIPDSLSRRLARFHLIDNTRGEPPMWQPGEVRDLRITMTPEQGRFRLEGTVRLETDSKDRGYEAKLYGTVEAANGRITRFDGVVRGQFWGEGTYTQGGPPGKFTLAIAFTLAGHDEAAKVPPQGARDIREYLRD